MKKLIWANIDGLALYILGKGEMSIEMAGRSEGEGWEWGVKLDAETRENLRVSLEKWLSTSPAIRSGREAENDVIAICGKASGLVVRRDGEHIGVFFQYDMETVRGMCLRPCEVEGLHESLVDASSVPVAKYGAANERPCEDKV